MRPKSKGLPTSPEDRKCQQIAPRSGSNQEAGLPVFPSVAETISILVYGKVTTLYGPAAGAPDMYQRWQVHVTEPPADARLYPLVHRMRLVLARVRWWKVRKRNKLATPAECPPALPPEYREDVRWAIRRYRMSAVQTLGLLRKDVRQLLAVQAETDRAIRTLCAEIGANHLEALGRPGNWRKGVCAGKHERIPSEFFANPHVTLLRSGWATCSPKAPLSERKNWVGPDWGDVRFRLHEVLALKGLSLDHQQNTEDVGHGGGVGEAPIVVLAHSRSERVRPAPTDRAVRDWMRRRVANWRDDIPAPSEEQDWVAAVEEFGSGLTQREFRLVRRSETPPEWRKQGRRLPWGKARNPSKKSVNPSRQN